MAGREKGTESALRYAKDQCASCMYSLSEKTLESTEKREVMV